MADDNTGLLPLIEVFGEEFLVDINRREYRKFDDPSNVIPMHSELGRKMLTDMQGKEWRSFGLETGNNCSAEV